MILGRVLNLCTCFELYKCCVISGCVSISKKICDIYLAVLKFVFSASVL